MTYIHRLRGAVGQQIKRCLLFAGLLIGVTLHAAQPVASQQIDEILAKYWKSQKVKGAPIVDDEIYLRRAYLTIVGRIPSYEEATTWLADESSDKRRTLVDELVVSEGFVSHQFNLWADALRIRTTGREGNVSGGKYFVPWLKNQLRANKPYDEWVREILAAEGAPWDNPASSYYLRDQGMPLDNMALTMQVFLGTQMQCAQCHNHPTDVWTRRDFYEMAAFRYAIDTRLGYNDLDELEPVLKVLRERDAEAQVDNEKKKKRNVNDLLNPAGRDLFRSMLWQTSQKNRTLKYPHDYQYDDVKAKSVVEPHTIFGETPDTIDLKGKARAEYYAEWVTSPDNPRFTLVIANRLWKSAMGRGVIEPIDDIRVDSKSTVPGLAEALTELMRQSDYDVRKFYTAILKTEFFQREAVVLDPEKPEAYKYTGPVLRRLSAEQLWDSYVVLLKPEVDDVPADYANEIPPPPGPVQLIATFTPDQLADYLASAEKAWRERNDARTAFYKIRNDPAMRDTEEYKQLQQAHKDADKKWRSYSNVSDSMSMMGVMDDMADDQPKPKNKGKKLKWWEKNLDRAADLKSPEYVDHWLRIFGQSDRDLVDNADDSSTINQALLLLNSNQTNLILADNSDPVQRVKKEKDPAKAAEILTLGFLTRYPNEKESAYVTTQWEADPKKTRERLAWAMVNTQEFLFIQ
ncbi:DUF1549 domain-containing protein [Cerasicoccus maritimus]|uniref:DUF1549 domain-containing protein n=1 Tax=Cerasicoccus maritimus TaxID=490089 RepID=UPI002852AC2B|nr:DUF1549 domain-containing protein [Cerasicoccus maritimus]